MPDEKVRRVVATALAQAGIVEADQEEQYALDYATTDRLIRELDERGWIITDKHAAHVPTPEELDDLLSDISMAGYASEAREIVEVWTRKWWGVESAFTTKWDAER